MSLIGGLRDLNEGGFFGFFSKALLLGMNWLHNTFRLGYGWAIIAITIIIKVLGELGKMKERFAQLIFGILILEDILGIAMIALLSGIAMTGRFSVGDIALTLGKLGMFLAVTLVVGLLIVPRLIGYVSRFKSNEMLIVTVLGLCFGVALLAAAMTELASLKTEFARAGGGRIDRTENRNNS